MNMWSSVVDRVGVVGTGVGTGLKWVWDNASIAKIATGTLTYTANTAFQFLEQGLALHKAIPALVTKPESRKILDGMAYLAIHDIVPVVGINFLNNSVQSYFQSTPYVGPILTLANFGVMAYTFRQGVQTTIRITALDALGPSAFNGDSNRTRLTFAEPKKDDTKKDGVKKNKKCTNKCELQKNLREPLVLMSNDLLVGAIGSIPQVGYFASRILRVFFNGRYITRLATPELCVRHKFQFMMQESILAFGLTYELQRILLDFVLESTIGMPPYLYYRALTHLLLLLEINLAAHKPTSVVDPKDATLPIDPLNIYERTCLFVANVLYTGLVANLRFDKNAKPLISLSSFLQCMTNVFNSGLERENTPEPGKIMKMLEQAKVWVLPPILHGTSGLINDPILVKYWPTVREGAIATLDGISSRGRSKTTATLALAPKSIATALYLIVGIPKTLTKVVLMLTQERDFWDFVNALKAWFERNNIRYEVVLAKGQSPIALLHGDRLIELPKENNPQPLLPAAQLVPQKPEKEPVIKPERLLSDKSKELPVVSSNPASLFTTRRRVVNSAPETRVAHAPL